MRLNPGQQQAVEFVTGPCLVLAGAGSGKTRVITNKIAHLIHNCGYQARHIAAVTFTNKAAREMKERVGQTLGRKEARGLMISTFHTLGLDIIKREYAALGMKSNFSLFDDTDQVALLKELTEGLIEDDKHNEEVRERWQNKIRYLLVDEYQDTNTSQYELVIKLEQNYRSSGRILKAANILIANNPHVFEKRLFSELGYGTELKVLSANNEDHEAERVTGELIAHHFVNKTEYKDYAILYRGNHQSRVFEKMLMQNRIPYKISGGTSFFSRPEIKDLLAYLRVLTNPDDDSAFLRILFSWMTEMLEGSEIDEPMTLTQVVTRFTLRDMMERGESEEEADQVQLMTLHASKGLEFPYVYLVGMEEGLLPHQSSIDEDNVDEERRLAYVGITRAQKELTFTLCKERRQYGELVRPEPSRFLLELPQDDLIWEQERKVITAEERMHKGQANVANIRAMLAKAKEKG
ncbi:hypothetical protein L1887_45360 [Cichorium endivia]|nr:hypothetical protein L1887_45360 [Cichorium endivia]